MNKDDMRTVEVSAHASREFGPDTFCLEISLHGERRDKASCIAAINESLNSVKKTLVDAGVDSDDIKDGEYSICPRYNRTRRGARMKQVPIAYTYWGDCSAECKFEPGAAARVMDALQDLGGELSFNVGFKLKDPDKCERELLREAVLDARARAEAIS